MNPGGLILGLRVYVSASQDMLPRPVAAASPGNWLEMQIRKSHPRPTESETQGWGPATSVPANPPRNDAAC